MKKKQKLIDWRLICIGLICLTAIEITALMKGINGVLLSTIIAIIALAIGVTIPNPIKSN